MLTVELLEQNTALATLTDEQKAAVVELSRNDENAVIGKRIGELHGQYDQDVLDATGVKKKDGEKSYDYVKRVLGEYKAKVESSKGVKADLDAANAKVADLQAKLEKGAADETLRQELKDTKTRVTQLQDQLKVKETEFAKAKAAHDDILRNVHLDYAFKSAAAEIKFKPGVTDTVRRVLLDSAKAEILAKGTPDFIDGSQLVFRDKDGNVLNNPQNNLNPYTLRELVMESSIKDMIDTGRQQTGGGTGAPQRKDTAIAGYDVTGARTQREADGLIEQLLLAEGLTRDSNEFFDRMAQIRKDNAVDKLPIR